MIGAYLQMAAALAVVVGTIFLLGYFLRKKQGSSSRLINMLAYQSFGPRKGIAAVKIGSEILLVGVTATDLKLLKTYDKNDLEPETLREISDKVKRLKDIKGHLNELK
jgi:flagellar biogenesis protein FliO